MIKKGLVFGLLLCTVGIVFAQKKEKESKTNLIVLASKPLSAKDSLYIENLFFLGLKEKISQNSTLATDYFNKILNIDPAHHQSFYELAQIQFNAKNFNLAQQNIEKATTVNSSNEWYWLLAYKVYQEQKNYDLVIYALNELITIEPEKVEYSLEKANLLINLKRADEAITVFNDLQKKEGLTDDIVEGRYKAYLSINEIEKAENDLLYLLKKEPKNFKYNALLGDFYFNTKKIDKAKEAYLTAKELDKTNPYINLALAEINGALGNTEDEFNELTQVFRSEEINIDEKIKIILGYFKFFPELKYVRYAETLSYILTEEHPDDAKSFSVYGDVLLQKNELEKAKIAYQQALKLDKNRFLIWDQLIRICLSLEQIDETVKNGEEALTYFPNQGILYYYTAIAYAYKKDNLKTVEYLNSALNFDLDEPLKVQIYSALGDAYQGLKKYEQSSNAYDKALSIDANNIYALNNYAYYLSERGEKLDKAAEMSLKSNKLEPNNASYLDTYAWVLFKSKKYQEAKLWIEKALKADKSNSAVLIEHYGDILYHVGDKENAILNWKKALEIGGKNEILVKKINEKAYSE